VEDLVIAKVNGELWDLERPLEGDCSLEFLKFDDEEGMKTILWVYNFYYDVTYSYHRKASFLAL